jgi:hypothetical protein
LDFNSRYNNIAFLIIILIFFCSAQSYSWENYSTHPYLTKLAITHLEKNEILSESVINNISPILFASTTEEDIPISRAWFHFSPRLDHFTDWATCDSIEWGFGISNCTAGSCSTPIK